MKISILAENSPGTFTAAEHGLSYLIEHDGKRLLFDTGQSDLFLINAEKMGVGLSGLDIVILSHGHYDHGNGLQYLQGGTLLCHPGCFVRRFRKGDRINIGLKNTRQELEEKFSLVTSSVPYPFTGGIIFLGEIPRETAFESKNTPFVLEDGSPDFITDDSAVAFRHKEGLFVVTGCGHAGIVNTLEHARNVTGERRLYGIMGGFHLKVPDRQTEETIRYLKENRLKHVYPSHCTALPALAEFYRHFAMNVVRTGDILEF